MTLDEANDAAAESADDCYRSTIVIMGQKRSGKTSIKKVVFQKMSPNETAFVESTTRVVDEPVRGSFINLHTVELPGQIDVFESSANAKSIFANCAALLFVIDAQADVYEPVNKITYNIAHVIKINPRVRFEVFIHKVDGLTEEMMLDKRQNIFQRVQDNLADSNLCNVCITYHMTSIYDHSIFEAFSKVIQKLVKQKSTLTELLDIFNAASSIEKSFIFDVASKIYIATDSNAEDLATNELCCDMIDVATDLAAIYGGLSSETHPPSDGYDLDSQAVIKLKIDQVMFMKQINKYLALVAVMRKENYDKQGIIDYNFEILRKSVNEVFEVNRRATLGVVLE